jgi:hypothetical protein
MPIMRIGDMVLVWMQKKKNGLQMPVMHAGVNPMSRDCIGG